MDIPEEAFAKPRGLNPPATNWQFVRDLIAYAYEHGYHEHGYDVLAELLGQVRAGASRAPGESRLPRETAMENEPDVASIIRGFTAALKYAPAVQLTRAEWSKVEAEIVRLRDIEGRYLTGQPRETPACPAPGDITYAIETLERYQAMSDPDCTCEPGDEKPCDGCRVADAIAGLRCEDEKIGYDHYPNCITRLAPVEGGPVPQPRTTGDGK